MQDQPHQTGRRGCFSPQGGWVGTGGSGASVSPQTLPRDSSSLFHNPQSHVHREALVRPRPQLMTSLAILQAHILSFTFGYFSTMAARIKRYVSIEILSF